MNRESGNQCQASDSPPDTGGVAAPSRKRREATAAAQTGWSGLTKCFGMRSLAVSAVYDRAYFVDSRKARGHRPRLQISRGEWRAAQFVHTFYERPIPR